jgi:hypothetical protein
MARFIVRPAGKRFGWQGVVYASDPRTGLLEIDEAAHAEALRALSRTMNIREVRDAGEGGAPPIPPSSSGHVPPSTTAEAGWRFRITAPLKKVTWRGKTHWPGSDGLLVVTDKFLALSLRERMGRGESGIADWTEAAPVVEPPGPNKQLDPATAGRARPVQPD